MPVDILVPPLSQTMDTLTLLNWVKKPGDTVKKGETLFTVETDKATLEVESPASGTLYEIFAQEDSEIEVRSVIGRILTEGEAALKQEEEIARASTPTREQRSFKKSRPVREETQKASAIKPGRLFSSPRARRLAEERNLDLSQAVPSGPRGMIVERDLEALTPDRGEGKGIPLSSTRKVIAQRMMNSHLGTAPVSYLCEADATELVHLREQILADLPESAERPTYSDLFIRIACVALEKYPDLNATIENGEVLLHAGVHISLAVDTDRGLIVPVMRDAHRLPIQQITQKRKQLVKRAITGKCTPDELSGGTFTISNLGMMGIDFFTPIINQPQVAILAVGRIRQVPAVINGVVHMRHMVGLGITCDHRVIDGAPAARFLNEIQKILVNSKSIV